MNHCPAPVLVSAHRGGAGRDRHLENTRAALERAMALDVDFVEFDVQRCHDGTFVVFHDDAVDIGGTDVPLSDLTLGELRAASPEVMTYGDVVAALAGRKRAHIDLKFLSPSEAYDQPSRTYEVAATALAVARLGAENIVVTTMDDRAVKAVRAWADARGHRLLVGLSLGRRVAGYPLWRQLWVRASEIWPHLRYRQSRANVVVAHHSLARLGVARFARNRRLPLLVWTVDRERSLRYWLQPGRAWLVTTNFPELALMTRRAGGLRP